MKDATAPSSVHQILSKHVITDGLPIVIDLEKSHGSYVVDQNGEEYLDMFSMFASSPIGYNHPSICAQQHRLTEVAINKLALSDIYASPYASFVETLERIAMPEPLSYFFFVDGGALANENAMKAAFDWKTRLNKSRGKHLIADQVIHFKQAFHGRSGYTLSLTNTNDPRKYQYFPLFDWPRITNPKCYFPTTEDHTRQTLQSEELAKQEINQAIQSLQERIACLIIEPIQAEGGDNYFRKEFLQYLRELCNEHDILLIFDEVQTGFGMTGKMWAFEHYDVMPDIISFGKKSQVCGIMANRSTFDRVENHVFKESSRLNSTFGGNLVDMVRCQLILEVIEKEKLIDNAKNRGKHLRQEIEYLAVDNPKITNVRGLGLFVAFDLPTAKERNSLIKDALDNKLLLLGCGERSIRFRPHLNVKQSELDDAVRIISKLV